MFSPTTGIAACNLDGVTLQSLFGIKCNGGDGLVSEGDGYGGYGEADDGEARLARVRTAMVLVATVRAATTEPRLRIIFSQGDYPMVHSTSSFVLDDTLSRP